MCMKHQCEISTVMTKFGIKALSDLIKKTNVSLCLFQQRCVNTNLTCVDLRVDGNSFGIGSISFVLFSTYDTN